jgi:hypothetical protein
MLILDFNFIWLDRNRTSCRLSKEKTNVCTLFVQQFHIYWDEDQIYSHQGRKLRHSSNSGLWNAARVSDSALALLPIKRTSRSKLSLISAATSGAWTLATKLSNAA